MRNILVLLLLIALFSLPTYCIPIQDLVNITYIPYDSLEIQHMLIYKFNLNGIKQYNLILIALNMQKLLPLYCIFNDNEYAWALLQAQISIELAESVDGVQIAQLLQLYMRGVEKMNSIMDSRESYFKNKISALMSKKNVIKSVNNNKHKSMIKKKNVDQVVVSQIKPAISDKNILNEKKKQLEMRMAYGVEENNTETLKIILAQQIDKQRNIAAKISNIIKTHQEKLMQRIMQRKMKTTTARSTSQANNINTSPNIKKKLQQIFNTDIKTKPYKKKYQIPQKRCKSVNQPSLNIQFYTSNESPTKNRARRQSIDLSEL